MDVHRLAKLLRKAAEKSNGASSKNPISFNGTDARGRSLLHYVCFFGHLDFLSTLCQSSLIDFNIQDRESAWTPLMHALYEGHLECALEMVRARADEDARLLELKDSMHMTPVEVAMFTLFPAIPSPRQPYFQTFINSSTGTIEDEVSRVEVRAQRSRSGI